MKSKLIYNRWTAVFLLLGCFLGLTVRPIKAQNQSGWIALSAGTKYDLIADSPTVAVHVPVTLAEGIEAAKVSLKLLDVSRDNLHDVRLLEAFNLHSPVKADKGHGPALAINVNLDKLPGQSQGAYNLLIEASTADQPNEQLTFQIIHPAASLKPWNTLIVNQIQQFPFKDEVIYPTFELREISEQSWLTKIDIQPQEFLDGSNQLVAGSLAFSAAPNVIDSGKSKTVGYTLVGVFPLGTSKGTVQVNTPQLESPQTYNFEVHKRLAPYWIVIIGFIGITLGYFGRTRLQERREFLETQLKGIELRDNIRRAISKYPDSTFEQDLKEFLEKLEQTIKGKNLDELNTAISAASQALTDAMASLNKRKQAALDLLAKLDPFTGRGWNLPEKLDESLKTMQESIKQAERKLNKYEVTNATKSLKDIQNNIDTDLSGTLQEWKKQETVNLERLSNPATEIDLPANVTMSLRDSIQPILNSLKQFPPINNQSTLEEVLTALQATNQTQTSIRDLNLRIGEWLNFTLGDFLISLPEEHRSGQDIDRLKTLVASLAEALEKAIEPLQPLLDMEKLSELNSGWIDVVRNRFDNLNQNGRDELEGLLDKHLFVEAARQLVVLLPGKPKVGAGGTMMGPALVETLPITILPSTLFHWSAVQVGSPALPTGIRVMREEAAPRQPDLTDSQVWRQLSAVRILQTVIAGALILALAYFMYTPSWIGNLNQIFQVFFWAFTADVTINWALQNVPH